ncbi:uncharacterized protein LOC127873043 [Dreissena polymorpha]|uniref:Uncharacterized protein n=1 Tax=Dreissena polymorpha TaxID=45954 RepID=A0A9D4KTJ1_DREPO|nr:uncharacterized protein LOC127873043 [Dreissena polymorpha]KAH3845359.1 hypothetical protein DPMN_087639 [Dreissena polymorpha]
MFKAIGRWSAQIRSNGLELISTIFGKGGKGRKYGGIDDETEEIFSDAKEELDSDDDLSSDSHKVEIHIKQDKTHSSDNLSTLNVLPSTVETDTQDKKSGADVTENKHGGSEHSSNSDLSGDVTDSFADKAESVKIDNNVANIKVQIDEPNDEVGDIEADKSEAEEVVQDHEHNHTEDNHHEVDHSDTKKMLKSKPGDIPKSSSSSSVFQKMHRRVNSYTQRQYAKFDNLQEDEHGHSVSSVLEQASTNGNNHVDNVISSIDHVDGDNSLLTSKSKKKRKMAKKARRAVRGTWKWLQRSIRMMVDTQGFLAPSFVSAFQASSARKT